MFFSIAANSSIYIFEMLNLKNCSFSLLEKNENTIRWSAKTSGKQILCLIRDESRQAILYILYT